MNFTLPNLPSPNKLSRSKMVQFKSAYPKLYLTLDEREAIFTLPALNNRPYDLTLIRDCTLNGEIYSFRKLLENYNWFLSRKTITWPDDKMDFMLLSRLAIKGC